MKKRTLGLEPLENRNLLTALALEWQTAEPGGTGVSEAIQENVQSGDYTLEKADAQNVSVLEIGSTETRVYNPGQSVGGTFTLNLQNGGTLRVLTNAKWESERGVNGNSNNTVADTLSFVTVDGISRSVVYGELSSATDVDWYSFKATAAGKISVQLYSPGNSNAKLELYNSSNVLLAAGTTTEDFRHILDSVSVTNNTTYKIRVTGGTGEYTLTTAQAASIETEADTTLLENSLSSTGTGLGYVTGDAASSVENVLNVTSGTVLDSAMDGNTLVTVSRESTSSPFLLQLWSYDGTHWTQQASRSDTVPSASSACLSLSNGTILLGVGTNVYVLKQDGTSFDGELFTVEEAVKSVSLDGNIAAIGLSDSVLIYENIADGWKYQTTLTGETTGEKFGTSLLYVAQSRQLYVGASSANTTGSVYVFTHGSGGWTRSAVVNPEENASQFGMSLDVEGNTMVVGALGKVCFFEWDTTSKKWTPTQSFDSTDLTTTTLMPTNLGCSVAISQDAVLVGASQTMNLSNPLLPGLTGSAYLFQRTVTGDEEDGYTTDWNAVQTFTTSATANGFGASVSLLGDRAVILDTNGGKIITQTGIVETDRWTLNVTEAGEVSFEMTSESENALHWTIYDPTGKAIARDASSFMAETDGIYTMALSATAGTNTRYVLNVTSENYTTQPLTLSFISPMAGEVIYASPSQIVTEFSSPLLQTSLLRANAKLMSSDEIITLSVSEIKNGNQIVWTLPGSQTLTPNQTYNLVVYGAEDIQGRILASTRCEFTYRTDENAMTTLDWTQYSHSNAEVVIDSISASGTLSSNDVAYYQFVLKPGETASFGLNDDVGGTLKLELFDPNHDLIAVGSTLSHVKDLYNQHLVDLTHKGMEDMVYTLRISCTDAVNLGLGETASYHLVGYKGATLESENNNSLDTATDITNSGGAVGSLPYPDHPETSVVTTHLTASQSVNMGKISVMSGSYAAVAGDNSVVLLQYWDGVWKQTQVLEFSCQTMAMENGVLVLGGSTSTQIHTLSGKMWTLQKTLDTAGTFVGIDDGTIVLYNGTALSFLKETLVNWEVTQTVAIVVNSLSFHDGTLVTLDTTNKTLTLWKEADGNWSTFQTLNGSEWPVSQWTNASVQISGKYMVLALPNESSFVLFKKDDQGEWSLSGRFTDTKFKTYILQDSNLLIGEYDGQESGITQVFLDEVGPSGFPRYQTSNSPITSLTISGERLLLGYANSGQICVGNSYDFDYYSFLYTGPSGLTVESFYTTSGTDGEYHILKSDGKEVETLQNGERYYIRMLRTENSLQEFPYTLTLTNNQPSWSMSSTLSENNLRKSLNAVTVKFASNVDLTTLANYSQVKIGNNACTGYILLDGQTVEFHFSGQVLSDGKYTFTVPMGAFQDLSGNTASLSVDFTISNELYLQSVSSNATSTAAPTQIQLTFSSSLNRTKLTADSLQINTGKGTVSSTGYQLSDDGKTISFTLPSDTMFYVTNPIITLTEAHFQTINGVQMDPVGNRNISLSTIDYTVRTQATDSVLKVIWKLDSAVSIAELTGTMTAGGNSLSGNFSLSTDGKTLTWISNGYTPVENDTVTWTLNNLRTQCGLPITGMSLVDSNYRMTGSGTIHIVAAIDSAVVVQTASTKSAKTTSASVPDSISWVDEWSTIYVEIWAYADSDKTIGEMEYSATLNYDSSLFLPGENLSFEKSALFDDLTVTQGTGDTLQISASNTDAFDGEQYVLVGRIALVPVENGGVTVNNGDYVLSCEKIGLSLSGERVSDISANLPDVYPVLYDSDDNGQINTRDLINFARVFGRSTTSSLQAYYSDYNYDNSVATRDLILLARNFGKKVGSKISFSENYPNAWPTHELVAETSAPQTIDAATLSQEQLDVVATAAVERAQTEYEGVFKTSFEGLTFQIADLGGNVLARQVGNVILVDSTAAGYGWYVDATPYDDTDDVRNGEIDLLTVLTHELGHYAGLEHASDSGSWMYESLATNLRKMPNVMDEIFGE